MQQETKLVHPAKCPACVLEVWRSQESCSNGCRGKEVEEPHSAQYSTGRSHPEMADADRAINYWQWQRHLERV